MNQKSQGIKTRKFCSDTFALSVMYDAILFLVLVSLSGVILFPALQPQTLSHVTIEEINEKKVDDIHQVLLSSTPKQCHYLVAGDLLDDTANVLGIKTTQENGLYQSIIGRVIGHEIHHSTFAQLIVEDLAVQWQLSLFNQNTEQLNLFTTDFSSSINEEIQSFLDEQIPQRYRYQFKANWYPIKGISFGGSITAGESPPATNYYSSKKTVSMPFSPALSWGNKTVVFSEYWIESIFLDLINESQNELMNISFIVQNIQHQNHSERVTDSELRTKHFSENLSNLFIDFTVNGISLSNDLLVFPGIVHLLINELFSSIYSVIQGVTDEAIQSVIGEGFAQIETFFSELNATSLIEPFEEILMNKVTQMFSVALNTSFASIDQAIQQMTDEIKLYIADLLADIIQPLVLQCSTWIIDHQLSLLETINMISSWIADQFSLSQATITLTIWEE